MSEHSLYRILAAALACMACLMAGVVLGVRTAPSPADGLVPVTTLDYANTYPDFVIACTHRGSRDDFAEDGSDIAVGDRLVRDCRVALP